MERWEEAEKKELRPLIHKFNMQIRYTISLPPSSLLPGYKTYCGVLSLVLVIYKSYMTSYPVAVEIWDRVFFFYRQYQRFKDLFSIVAVTWDGHDSRGISSFLFLTGE